MGVLDFLNTGLQAGATVLNQVNQRKAWQREDTAVQRRVRDLKKAGLSPTLAAGSAASSSGPIRIEAPQFKRDVEAQSAGIAETKAQRELTEIKAKLEAEKMAEAKFNSKLFDIMSKLKSEGYGAEPMNQLAISNFERMLAESVEAKRNIDLFQKYGVPSTNAPGAGTIANVEMLKGLFPGIGPENMASLSILGRIIAAFAGGLR